MFKFPIPPFHSCLSTSQLVNRYKSICLPYTCVHRRNYQAISRITWCSIRYRPAICDGLYVVPGKFVLCEESLIRIPTILPDLERLHICTAVNCRSEWLWYAFTVYYVSQLGTRAVSRFELAGRAACWHFKLTATCVVTPVPDGNFEYRVKDSSSHCGPRCMHRAV